jgi:hypothetical protein
MSGTSKQIAIALGRQPPRPDEMRVMRASRTRRLAGRVDPEDDSAGLLPGGAVLGGVEQAEIDREVLAIIFGQMRLFRSYIFDCKGTRRTHERSILKTARRSAAYSSG